MLNVGDEVRVREADNILRIRCYQESAYDSYYGIDYRTLKRLHFAGTFRVKEVRTYRLGPAGGLPDTFGGSWDRDCVGDEFQIVRLDFPQEMDEFDWEFLENMVEPVDPRDDEDLEAPDESVLAFLLQ